MLGHSVIKQRYGLFNTVTGDMKLEQTILEPQKSTGA